MSKRVLSVVVVKGQRPEIHIYYIRDWGREEGDKVSCNIFCSLRVGRS